MISSAGTKLRTWRYFGCRMEFAWEKVTSSDLLMNDGTRLIGFGLGLAVEKRFGIEER